MDKIACRTPAEARDGVTNIPRWKFELLRSHILELVRDAGVEGYRFSQLKGDIAARLSADEAAQLGSIGWHSTVVKLEMEVAGDLQRLEVSPQRLVCGDAAD